jgi:hypothetical protein
MNRLRVFASLLLLGAVLAVGYQPARAEESACGECGCYKPNTDEWGVIKNNACETCTSCYIKVT